MSRTRGSASLSENAPFALNKNVSDGIPHSRYRELTQIPVGSAQYGDVFVPRRPNIRIGRPKQQDTAGSRGRCKMRNSGIVADKSGMRQNCGEMGQGEGASKTKTWIACESGPQLLHRAFIGFA